MISVRSLGTAHIWMSAKGDPLQIISEISTAYIVVYEKAMKDMPGFNRDSFAGAVRYALLNAIDRVDEALGIHPSEIMKGDPV